MMIGLTAGPDMPPVLKPSDGRKLSVSMRIARIVLATVSASAPASSAARAMPTTSPAFGDSLTITGRSVAARMARTVSPV